MSNRQEIYTTKRTSKENCTERVQPSGITRYADKCLGQLVSVIMLYFTELPVPVAAVSVFYTPNDGRMTSETCRESLQ